jgi:outer membrane lipopolysaccharide assembly protein LptE/RlpB
MSITKEEAVKIVKFMKIKNIEYIKLWREIFKEGIKSSYNYEIKKENRLYIIDGEENSDKQKSIKIIRTYIDDDKLHIVLETEEELLIPIRDD